MSDLTCPSCNTTDVTVLRVRAGTRWKRTSFYCADCSLLSSQQEPITQRVSIDYMPDDYDACVAAGIVPYDEGPPMSTPEDMKKAAVILLAGSDPLNPIFAAEDKLTQQVDDEVYVTVYWLDANDRYATVGWPVPMWLIECMEPGINMTGSESLRLWL